MRRRFKLRVKLLALAAGFAFSLPAFADSYSFTSSTGNLGTSHTFTVNGANVTATGYSNTGVATNLYFKNSGGNETGLGLAGTPDHEISGTGFVQFGLGTLLATTPGATLTFGSVSPGEGFIVYGSNVAGALGTWLGSGTSANTTFTLPSGQNYKYISVASASGNVLITGIKTSISVPEPGTLFLLFTGMLGMIGAAAYLRR